MAASVTPGRRAAPKTPARTARHARIVSIVAGVLALNELTLRGALASTMVAVGAPVAATGFVYGVSAMREARLAYEATDRVRYAARFDPASSRGDDSETPKHVAADDEGADTARKLDSMLASRAVLVDTFGSDPSTVAPIYVRIIKQMLHDDEETLASLSNKKSMAHPRDAAKIAERETRLRAVHQQLTRLVGA